MMEESHNARSLYVFIPPPSPYSIWKYLFLIGATKILIKNT
jgi:hypothetical protein